MLRMRARRSDRTSVSTWIENGVTGNGDGMVSENNVAVTDTYVSSVLHIRFAGRRMPVRLRAPHVLP